MNGYFYSKRNNGFYHFSLKSNYEDSAGGWPDDAVAISDEYYQYIIDGQKNGMVITADSKGKPMLVEPKEPSFEDMLITAKDYRSKLMAEATEKIAPLQDAVDIGVAKKEEQLKLIEWKKYRVLLHRIDLEQVPNIIWPERPS